MFPLSDSAKQAWQRYESGQGRFRFGYRVFFTESSFTTFTHYGVQNLEIIERAIQATDKKFPFPQCSFSCDVQIVTQYNSKGNFYLQGYLSEFTGYDNLGKPKWTAYWMSRTPWFSVIDVSRDVGGVAKYRYSAQARSKAEDEKLFFGTQYPYTTTTDFKKTYEDIFKYYHYLGKTHSARTWGSGSEISALLNALPKEDYDYSGDGLQILFNHFRNSGYYLKLGYVPEYSPTSAQRVAYDVDFDLQAVPITDLSTVDTANLPQISLGDCSDIPKIEDRDFIFNVAYFSVSGAYFSTAIYGFSPALNGILPSGVTDLQKRTLMYQVNVKDTAAMPQGSERDFFSVSSVGLYKQQYTNVQNVQVTTGTLGVNKYLRITGDVDSSTRVNVPGSVTLKYLGTPIAYDVRTINFPNVTLPYTWYYSSDYEYVTSDISVVLVDSKYSGHTYIPWSGNAKKFMLLPGTYTMPDSIDRMDIEGYCVNVYAQTEPIVADASDVYGNIVKIDAHTYDVVTSKSSFSKLVKKQYTISGVFPLMPFYEIYDIVKLYTPNGTRVAQIVKKKVSLDSASMELTFECQQNPERILPSVWT